MNDKRELLKLAAKAAGYTFDGAVLKNPSSEFEYDGWNPLEDDGDALRLAVKLQLTICNEHLTAGAAYCTAGLNWTGPSVDARWPQQQTVVDGDYAATRRAIVRAAAAIGEAMP
jgi:hypothetical protein